MEMPRDRDIDAQAVGRADRPGHGVEAVAEAIMDNQGGIAQGDEVTAVQDGLRGGHAPGYDPRHRCSMGAPNHDLRGIHLGANRGFGT